MVVTENKNSFFLVTVDLPASSNFSYQLDKIQNAMDLIFTMMKVKNTWYKFLNKNNRELIYLFKSEDRKRKGQLEKYCHKILPDNEYQINSLSKFDFERDLSRFQNNDNFKLSHQPLPFSEYSANDIKIFDDVNNWFPWQKEIYKQIFNKDGSFKEPHPRHIISIVDKAGNSGKSSFWKYWFFNYPEDIGRMGYGSASQLRSAAVNLGQKKLYIVDLARSKSSNDKEEDLLSALEDIKSGFITNAMYGSGKTLIMEPPHIVVSSNYVLNYDLLSSDRWKIYELNKKHQLVPKDPKKLKVKSSEESVLKK